MTQPGALTNFTLTNCTITGSSGYGSGFTLFGNRSYRSRMRQRGTPGTHWITMGQWDTTWQWTISDYRREPVMGENLDRRGWNWPRDEDLSRLSGHQLIDVIVLERKALDTAYRQALHFDGPLALHLSHLTDVSYHFRRLQIASACLGVPYEEDPNLRVLV